MFKSAQMLNINRRIFIVTCVHHRAHCASPLVPDPLMPIETKVTSEGFPCTPIGSDSACCKLESPWCAAAACTLIFHSRSLTPRESLK